MLVAVPVWQGRVSPVFDVAGQLLVTELEGPAEVARRQEALGDDSPETRARRLSELGIETLICGAISRPLVDLLAAGRIEVISEVCGDVEQVLQAYRSGQLPDDRFAMPGCCGRRQQRRRQCRRGRRFQEK